MLNHVNSCVLCVCLLFNFRLFTVINLSPKVLSAQPNDTFLVFLFYFLLLLLFLLGLSLIMELTLDFADFSGESNGSN